MAVSAITGNTAAASTPTVAQSKATSTQDQFLKLLVTQMQNQDPMSPMSSSEFMSQMSSLSTVEGINNLNSTFKDLLMIQGLGEGAALIGKKVEYKDAAQNTQTGTVQAARIEQGGVVLTVGGNDLNMKDISKVIGN
jgi:flagellar basal-body rod modification protein FlgD